MTVHALLADLRRRGVQVHADLAGLLRVTGRATAEDLAQLAARKDEVLAALRGEPTRCTRRCDR